MLCCCYCFQSIQHFRLYLGQFLYPLPDRIPWPNDQHTPHEPSLRSILIRIQMVQPGLEVAPKALLHRTKLAILFRIRFAVGIAHSLRLELLPEHGLLLAPLPAVYSDRQRDQPAHSQQVEDSILLASRLVLQQIALAIRARRLTQSFALGTVRVLK